MRHMAKKQSDQREPLESVDGPQLEQDHGYMREIPKSSVKPEHHHLMYLLEQRALYFLDAELTELRDSFQVNYHVHDHVIRFDDIKSFTKDKKLRYLLNVAKLEEVRQTRYAFKLEPSELHFTKNGLPLMKTRGLKQIVEPLPLSEAAFLIRYKALVIYAFNDATSFETLVEGNLELHKGTPFEQRVIQAETLEELKSFLNEQYDQQNADYTQNFAYVRKARYSVFKWLGIGASVVAILIIACLAYLYFSIMKTDAQIASGYKAYVKEDYTQVLNDYEDLNGKALEREALYIYARSYIETNKQGLEKENKAHLLKNITPNSNEDYLLYWVELGQGHLDEALNIATYLDDNDIMKLALINKLNNIKNNPDLSNEKRSEQTKTYNDKLQDILDKEKAAQEASDKEKEAEDKAADEKLKQQEENEKKQKEQERKDREKRQAAERKK